MSFGLIQFGATPRTTAYAAADAPAVVSITAQAAKDFQVSTVRPVAPVENPGVAREQALKQAMAARGVDAISMFKMTAQDRIEMQAAIRVETSRRTSIAPLRETGNFVDIRV